MNGKSPKNFEQIRREVRTGWSDAERRIRQYRASQIHRLLSLMVEPRPVTRYIIEAQRHNLTA